MAVDVRQPAKRDDSIHTPMPTRPRVTTRTGDDGRTSLWGKERVPKYDLRIAVMGDLDEAQSAMGLARALAKRAIASELLALQRGLYELLAEIGTSPEKTPAYQVDASKVAALEATTERLKAGVDLAGAFVIPGGDPAAAAIDLSRAVVRRAERGVARMLDERTIANREVLRYLNRLSDVLFVLARAQEGRKRVAARSREAR